MLPQLPSLAKRFYGRHYLPKCEDNGAVGWCWVANCQAQCLGRASKEIDVALEDGPFQVVLKLSLRSGEP